MTATIPPADAACPTELAGLCWCTGIGIAQHRTSLSDPPPTSPTPAPEPAADPTCTVEATPGAHAESSCRCRELLAAANAILRQERNEARQAHANAQWLIEGQHQEIEYLRNRRDKPGCAQAHEDLATVEAERDAERARADAATEAHRSLRKIMDAIAESMRWTADVWEPDEDPKRRFLRAVERDIRSALAAPAPQPAPSEREEQFAAAVQRSTEQLAALGYDVAQPPAADPAVVRVPDEPRGWKIPVHDLGNGRFRFSAAWDGEKYVDVAARTAGDEHLQALRDRLATAHAQISADAIAMNQLRADLGEANEAIRRTERDVKTLRDGLAEAGYTFMEGREVPYVLGLLDTYRDERDKALASATTYRLDAEQAMRDMRQAEADLAEARREAERLRGEVRRTVDDMQAVAAALGFDVTPYADQLRALASTGGSDTTGGTDG